MSDEKLGRYSLVRRIGKGGMGEVWLAKSSGAHGFEKTVALKRILPQFSSNPHVVNMLVDEARISVLLNHPNVVQVLELGEDNGNYFIAMEYVEGHALSRLLRRLKKMGKRLDVLEACYILIQLLEGLHAAHVQKDQRGKPAGIIHRDVSPQNVLISMDGVVKVIDFGIARARERLEVTQSGSVKGKLRYMAPEQLSPKLIKGKPIDHRVDVFSAGIVMFEMLANRQRFPGDIEIEIMDAILKEDTPDLAKEGVVDRELMDILDTALEKDREVRFKDAAQFAGHLRSYLYKRDPGFTAERVAKKMRDAFNDPADEKEEPEPPESESVSAVDPSQGQAMRDKRVRDVSKSGAMHGEGDDREDATRTAFRPPVRASKPLREVDPDTVAGVTGAGTGTIARRPQRQKSSGPAIVAGLVLGVALLAVGWFVVKPRFLDTPGPVAEDPDAHTNPLARPDGPRPTTNPLHVVAPPPPASSSSGPTADVLVEAEPATTRISLADQPDPKYVSPARIKLRRNDTVELVFEADGYETERHKFVVSGDNPTLKVQLHPLPVDLILHVYPRDAAVTVNGAPAKVGMKVIPGQMIEIRADHPFATQPKIVQVVPQPAQPLTIEIRLDEVEQAVKNHPVSHGSVMITSKPPGCEVYVDGQKLRAVTPTKEVMSPGEHHITVSRPDGKGERSFAVDLVDGDVKSVEAVLE